MEQGVMPFLESCYRMLQEISQLGLGVNIYLERAGMRMANSQMLLLRGILWYSFSRAVEKERHISIGQHQCAKPGWCKDHGECG